MMNKFGFFVLFLVASIFACLVTLKTVNADEAMKISVDEICESNMDEPMGADNRYKDKSVRTSIEVNKVNKIYSLCHDAPKGTFTVEFTTKSERVIQCFCSAPDQKSILDTTTGSTVNIEGVYKSMTATFFETESKQCTITIKNCTFN